jgi:uncharacterized membrane protein
MLELGLATGLAVAVVLVLGGVVTAAAYRAFRRTGSRALRSLAIGIGVITVAAAAGATLHHVLAVDLALALLVQTMLTAVGFAALIASLYLDPPVSIGRAGDG